MAYPTRRQLSPIPLLSLALFLLFAMAAVAQQATVLDLSELPQCASSCAALIQTNTNCVPPVVASASQSSYQACFCNSPVLAPFKANPAALSCPACQPADLQTIQTYYNSLCSSTASTSSTSQAAVSSTGTSTSASGAASTTMVANPGQTSQSTTNNGATTPQPTHYKSWISTHYQWVILLIVLALAFVFFLTFGFWLKRRHKRKQEARLSGVGPLTAGSPYASGNLSVGGAGNHPQMTVVPGAGSEAAMARYDGSGLNSLGSRPQSMVRTSIASGGLAPYTGSSRDAVGRNPPAVLADLRQNSEGSSNSRRKKMRSTLRATAEDGDDDVEAIGSGAEQYGPGPRASVEGRQTRPAGLKGKLRKTLGK